MVVNAIVVMDGAADLCADVREFVLSSECATGLTATAIGDYVSLGGAAQQLNWPIMWPAFIAATGGGACSGSDVVWAESLAGE